MHNCLGIAMAAYLLGALIEGISIVRELSQALPKLLESTEDDASKLSEPPNKYSWVLVVITVFIIAGAFCWPCRLIHRSMKENQDSSNQRV